MYKYTCIYKHAFINIIAYMSICKCLFTTHDMQ